MPRFRRPRRDPRPWPVTAATAARRCIARSSNRSAAPTGQRRTRRQRGSGRRPAGAHPAGLPFPPARRGALTANRARAATATAPPGPISGGQGSRRHRGARRQRRLLADLVGAGTGSTPPRAAAAAGQRCAGVPRPQGPGFALLGSRARTRLTLELKTVADVGLVGFPVGGQIVLVSTISAAKPKIADYPFTTLVPNLGVVSAGRAHLHRRRRPRLIPGASAGRGLGLDFLRHIERCAVLVHVWTAPQWNPVATRSPTSTR